MIWKVIVAIAVALAIIAGFLVALLAVDYENKQQACYNMTTVVSPIETSVEGDGVSARDSVFPVASNVTLNQQQLENAEIILGVAISRDLSVNDAALGPAVALQETDLVNANYGDEDSLGLFQQRPSQGWGTEEQLLNPVYASNKFYDAILKVWNRDQKTMVEIAIEAQIPDEVPYEERWKRYNWDPIALNLAKNAYQNAPGTTGQPLGEIEQSLVQTAGCKGVGGNVGVAIAAATSQVGTTYQWEPPSEESRFDGVELVQFAYQQAGVTLEGNAATLLKNGDKVKRENLAPGDLVFWRDGDRPTQVSMYLGDDKIIGAPTYNGLVYVSQMSRDDGAFVGATRPATDAADFEPGKNGWVSPFGDDSYPITSPYGMRYLERIGYTRLHAGLDFGAGLGVPIYAVADGTVTFAQYDGGRGNQVRILHTGNVVSVSAHLSSFAPGISPGDSVKAGDFIGRVGTTGASVNYHLHFELRKNGSMSYQGDPFDPYPFLTERGVSF